jgi:hypothetical protein
MTRQIVKAVVSKKAPGDDWPLMYCLCDYQGRHWWITTDHIRGGEEPPSLSDAETTAALVAKLLNDYFAAGGR